MKTFRLLIGLFFTVAITVGASPILLIQAGTQWKYLVTGTDPGTLWREPAYDDGAWQVGMAQLGYGDGDEVTVVGFGPDPNNKYVTTYFRRMFDSPLGNVSGLTLRLLRDDGAVVYLNGVAVYRNNMPEGPITYNTLATAAVGGAEESTQFVTANINPQLLHAGANLIAVEVHQNSVVSSDMSFDFELLAEAVSIDLPVVNVAATTPNTAEASPLALIAPGVFTFTRTFDTSQELTVFIRISGTASNGVDYARVTNQVTFPPGAAETRVQILGQMDNLIEGTETVVITLEQPPCLDISPPLPGCYRVGLQNEATVFIHDMTPQSTVSVQAIDGQGAEVPPNMDMPENPAVFRITRAGPAEHALTITYALSGSASNGVDYAALSGVVEMAAGARIADVVIEVVSDNLQEGTESVVLTLTPPICPVPPHPGCYRLGVSNVASAIILDSPTMPNHPPHVQLNEPQNGDVFKAPTNIVLRAYADDQEDGVRLSIEFFANDHSLGFGTFVPALCPSPYCPFYALVWSNAPPGNYALTARATDSSGASSNSAPVHIVVEPGEPQTNVTLVAFGSVWKYLDNGTDQGTAWRSLAFDDSTWASGPAQLGYGDGDEATVVSFGPDPANKYITTYFRRGIHVVNAGSFAGLRGRLLQDDGAVVYLNGAEIFRSNLPAGVISFNTLATTAPLDNQIVDFTMSGNLLREGVNVVAVEMHQVNPSSTDISFDLELIGQGGPKPPELPVVNVIASDPDAAESGVLAAIFPGTFTFHRSGPTSNSLIVSFALGGSAINGIDYRYVSNEVRFASGQAEAPVNIFPLNDNLVEGTENVVVTLESPACIAIVPPPPGCYRVGPSNRAEVFITDANGPINTPPYVQLNRPQNGDVFRAPANIVLQAFAQDHEDGYQVRVEFFADGTSLGFGQFQGTTCPAPFCPYYELIWSNVPPGDYTLIARATDSSGASSNSAPVHILVEPGEPQTNVTLVAFGSVWKYLDNGTDQGTAWRSPAFDDSTWASGPAQLGYGDGDEATVVSFGPDPANKYITTYFRRSIHVVNAGSFAQLKGRLLQDDGGAVYLNGEEIFRSNLPPGPISFNTLASSVSPENQIVEFTVPGSLLHVGANVIAVEMHQVNAASSDLSFDLELIGAGGPQPPELPVVNVVATDPDAAESGMLDAIFPGTFTFHRSGPTSNALTVFVTLSGSALNGIDYIRVSNAVHFAVGEAEAQVDIYPLNDDHVEGTETAVLILESPACIAIVPPPPGCYRVGSSGQATVFIRDASVPTNRPPHVQINEPRPGAIFDAPANITLVAYAQDPEDSYNVRVEFFAADRSLGFGTFVPSRCATPYCPNFTLTWSNVPPGTYTLRAKATDQSGAHSFSEPVIVTVREGPSEDRELHVVGIHTGSNLEGRESQQQGHAAVVINRPGKRVTLFGSAYWGVTWHITVTEGTILEKVILAGYYPQSVEGIGPDVEFQREWVNYYIGYTLESGQFYRVAPRVRRLTGLEISSFHGAPAAPYPTPFVVDSVQDDPRLHSSYPVPTPLSELPDLRFNISFLSGGVSTMAYTLAGPVNGGDLLPNSNRAVPDENGRYYYALSDNGLLQIDSNGGAVRELPVPPDLPELSWPMSLAYDTTRRRALLVSLGGEGHLYAYSPTEDRWSVVSSMNNLDLASLTYHAHDDSLYGMEVSHSEAGYMSLYRLNANGGGATELRLPIYPWGVHMHSSELVSVGEYLVVLLNPSNFIGDPVRDDEESRMYLVKPATGEAWLTVRQPRSIHPNQPPEVSITAPTNGATFAPLASIQITAVAIDYDNYASKVEFFANAIKMGEAMIPPETGGSVFDFTWQNVPAGAYALTAKATDLRGGVGISPPVNIRVGANTNTAACPCDAPWSNHAQYVNCVIRRAWALYRAGEITADQRRAMIRDAIESDCGKHPPTREPITVHLLPLTHQECHRDGVQVVLSGDATGPCVLEYSGDLVNWTALHTVDINGWEISCPIEVACKARFYRVRMQTSE